MTARIVNQVNMRQSLPRACALDPAGADRGTRGTCRPAAHGALPASRSRPTARRPRREGGIQALGVPRRDCQRPSELATRQPLEHPARALALGEILDHDLAPRRGAVQSRTAHRRPSRRRRSPACGRRRPPRPTGGRRRSPTPPSRRSGGENMPAPLYFGRLLGWRRDGADAVAAFLVHLAATPRPERRP